MPSGPGVISEETIANIVAFVQNKIDTFLLTSKQDVASIINQHKKCKTNTIQIVDTLLSGSHKDRSHGMTNSGEGRIAKSCPIEVIPPPGAIPFTISLIA